MQRTKISVVVVEYNSDRDKLLRTLYSILIQKNVDFEIVVADDGSEADYFLDIEDFFKNYSFTNYKLVKSKENQGTVRNILLGINNASGEYIKTISPGDYLASECVLSKWQDKILKEGSELCFGNVIYYQMGNDGAEIIRHKTSPQFVTDYEKHDQKSIIHNYLLLNDSIHGVSYICKKDLLKSYLTEMEGKVIFAEDTLLKLLVFDGHRVDYHDETVVFYEYGYGISTVKSEFWKKKIREDMRQMDQLLMNRAKREGMQNLIIDSIRIRETNNKLMEACILLKYPKTFVKRIIMKFHKRHTGQKVDEGMQKILNLKEFC